MAPLVHLSFRKVLLIYLVVFLYASALILCDFSETDHEQIQSRKQILGMRRMLSDFDDALEALTEEKQKPKKKSTSTTSTSTTTTTTSPSSNKNQTKLSKPKVSTKNQTKLIATTTSSTKNQTKPLKATNSTKSILSSKSELKKLNSTSHQLIKKLNSTSKSKPSNSTKTKPLDPLIKPTSSPPPKNNTKTTKSTSTTKPNQNTITNTKKPQKKTTTKQTQPSWIEDDDDAQDLVSEFRDLPIKFQQTLLPDLERISTTSKAYINKYNKEITKKYFNPIVGNKYAPTIASIVSFAFILVPLLLVSLVINHFKAYFSLQKVLIFVQVYLSIYFTILCLSSIVTGLEPLKFLYATSRSTYICLQVLQTLGYILYLLMLLMYLVLVFSTDCGLGTRLLGLAQTFVGFAVGLHYYVAVFHRVVLHQPPRTNWKIHAIYATCFLVICLFNRADRRKKAYLEEGGEEGVSVSRVTWRVALTLAP